MRSRSLPFLATLSFAVLSFAVMACRKEAPQAPQQFQGNPTGPTPYGTGAAPAAPAATPAGTIAPGPFAPACSILEGTCGYARCNMQVLKCAWPCGSNNDCVAGSTCIGAGTLLGTCGPSLGAPTP